ncbi:protein of unknown function [Acidithiobacillus ferrivorans]|uniref:Primase C-terminal 1 domain-containing protein n=1 Tax=Acidithiobacillus ferrivorans TaxID=160808 RepID=A0A060UZ78_9PROT|nr:replication initiation protein [Acidithiobacillus ferrivorans]CDQ11963.1 hypothetical protein AFERRI_600189 [Acidithiobacillus ferrivorans]SMH65518.1 protein of unknown function [Acidithiobacillus ferrivorans]
MKKALPQAASLSGIGRYDDAGSIATPSAVGPAAPPVPVPLKSRIDPDRDCWVDLLRKTRGALNRDNIRRCIALLMPKLSRCGPWTDTDDDLCELWAELRRIENNAIARARKKRQRATQNALQAQTDDGDSKGVAEHRLSAGKIVQLFASRIPDRPYCTDNFSTGVRIRPRTTAMCSREIQPNAPWSRQCLVLDLDHDRPFPDGCPPPQLIVHNPTNGHRHGLIVWETPILIGPSASRKGQKFYEDTAAAIQLLYAGDPNYRGTLCHNPLSAAWRLEILHPDTYQLSDFREVLKMAKEQGANNAYRSAGAEAYAVLGRNCATWEACRYFGYALGPRPDLYNRIREQIDKYNVQHNTPPLGPRECHNIAKSITAYVMSGQQRGQSMTDEDWQTWVAHTHRPKVQARRGRLGGLAKGAANAHKRTMAWELAEQGLSARAIAAQLDVSAMSVSRWLRG